MDTSRDVAATYHVTADRPGAIGMFGEAVGELRSRWRLILYLAQADLKRKGTDTLFGNIWWILDPLLQMVVYVILVTVIFARTQEAYPLFIFAAILPWKWFVTVTGDSITSVTGQGNLIKQIQFPKIVLPAAAMLAGIVQFAFGLIPLGAMMLFFYRDRLSWAILALPVVMVVQFTFSAAFGMIVAGLNVFFRDVGNLARHVLRLWFYLSPTLYGADTIAKLGVHHPRIAMVMHLNPFYSILEGYRQPLYYGQLPDFLWLGIVMLFSLVLLFLGTIFFKRIEPAFAKVL